VFSKLLGRGAEEQSTSVLNAFRKILNRNGGCLCFSAVIVVSSVPTSFTSLVEEKQMHLNKRNRIKKQKPLSPSEESERFCLVFGCTLYSKKPANTVHQHIALIFSLLQNVTAA